MNGIVGIRREHKNRRERRVPLTPADVAWLRETAGVRTIVEPSPIRVFPDRDYQEAGASVSAQVSPADVVFAVKQIRSEYFEPGKAYVFFSHTIKGQPGNMPMLRRLMELGCSLVDYERVVDDGGKRLIFFGRFAGLAGAVDSLHALGRKLALRGFETPFADVRRAFDYASVEEAKAAVAAVGRRVAAEGLPPALSPLVLGVTGSGNVSTGAQEMLAGLSPCLVPAEELPAAMVAAGGAGAPVVLSVFNEGDLVRRLSGPFDLDEYYRFPERYESRFEDYLPHVSVLVNAIYWTPRYPRFVTRGYLREAARNGAGLRLLVVGDVSCDIGGSVEITSRATEPDHAYYTYDPVADASRDGIARDGVTVLAVDNLPCEFPAESSAAFSLALREFVAPLAAADFTRPYEELHLPEPVRRALVLHHGRLTPPFAYLSAAVEAS